MEDVIALEAVLLLTPLQNLLRLLEIVGHLLEGVFTGDLDADFKSGLVLLLLLDDLDLLEGNEKSEDEHGNERQHEIEPALEEELQPPAVLPVHPPERQIIKTA